jgi:hypothetical protein
MKKLLIIAAAALLIFTGACKKDKTEEPAKGKNTWALNGTEHTVAYTNKSETSGSTPTTLLIFADAPFNAAAVNTLNFSFIVPPAASGTYQLVGVGAAKTDKQFELFAGSAAGAYAYIGTSVDIEVTVNSGKVTVTIPEIALKSTKSGEADAKLTASVYEL